MLQLCDIGLQTTMQFTLHQWSVEAGSRYHHISSDWCNLRNVQLVRTTVGQCNYFTTCVTVLYELPLTAVLSSTSHNCTWRDTEFWTFCLFCTNARKNNHTVIPLTQCEAEWTDVNHLWLWWYTEWIKVEQSIIMVCDCFHGSAVWVITLPSVANCHLSECPSKKSMYIICNHPSWHNKKGYTFRSVNPLHGQSSAPVGSWQFIYIVVWCHFLQDIDTQIKGH